MTYEVILPEGTASADCEDKKKDNTKGGRRITDKMDEQELSCHQRVKHRQGASDRDKVGCQKCLAPFFILSKRHQKEWRRRLRC